MEWKLLVKYVNKIRSVVEIYFFFLGWLDGWMGASYLTNRWDRDSLIIKSAEKRDSTRFGLFFSKMFSDNISVCVCVCVGWPRILNSDSLIFRNFLSLFLYPGLLAVTGYSLSLRFLSHLQVMLCTFRNPPTPLPPPEIIKPRLFSHSSLSSQITNQSGRKENNNNKSSRRFRCLPQRI